MSDMDAFAADVVLLVQRAIAPIAERLAKTEALLSTAVELRDRVVAVEVKSSIPATLPVVETKAIDLSPVLERVSAAETRLTDMARVHDLAVAIQRDMAAMGERVAVIETRPQVPGPTGEPGPAGKDGTDGKDGTAGLSFEGVYQDGKSYDVGNLVTWGGSSWHANEATTSKPGDGSKSWTLMVKRGRDGKDGQDAPSLPVVRTR